MLTREKAQLNVGILIFPKGEPQGKVKEYLSKQNLNCKMRFVGWIPHNESPNHLNGLKVACSSTLHGRIAQYYA